MGHGQTLSRLCGTLWLMGATAHAVGPGYDPAEVLRRVREKVSANNARTLNYTCVQTVKRDVYHPAAATLRRPCANILEQRQHPAPDMVLHLASTDRLRMDVTLIDRGEIYSWVGASRFEEEGIEKVVRSGAISTGAFGGYLVVIFQQDVKEFRFIRQLQEEGRARMEYGFDVPATDSNFLFSGSASSRGRAAYHGTFTADAETADVVRLSFETGELPSESGNCMVSGVMEYVRVRIGDGEFLLPATARHHFVHPSGSETDNVTRFSQCHEYRGESSIHFLDDGGTIQMAGARNRAAEAPVIEGGLVFEFETIAPIDLEVAAAGDVFTGRLVRAFRNRAGKMLEPKGAPVSGRLLRVEVEHWPRAFSIIVMEPQTVGRRPVQAVRADRNARIQLPLNGEERAGVFRVEAGLTTVPAKFKSIWRTVASSAGEAGSAVRP